jgi:hypothetical protein
VNSSTFRVRDLRFGDFNGDGRTDVFGIVGANWMFSDAATSPWTMLRPRLTDTVADLFIGDFDGDGRDDVGHVDDGLFSDEYEFWSTPAPISAGVPPPALAGFRTIVDTGNTLAAVGRFLGGGQSRLLFWDDNKIDIAFLGSGGLHDQSRHDMK